MSEVNDDNQQYSAFEIQRYLDGRMSGAEMHAFEKAALEDPFLADAIEGIRAAKKEYGSDSIMADLEQLRAQIAKKATGGKLIMFTAFPWWRIAAVACVLVVCSVLAYNTWLKPESTNAIAVNDTKSNDAGSIAPAAPGNTISEKDTSKETITKNSEEGRSPSVKMDTGNQGQNGRGAVASAPHRDEKNSNPESVKEPGKSEPSVSKEVTKVDEAGKDKKVENEIALEKQVVKEERAIPGVVSNNDLAKANDPSKNVKGKAAGVSSNATLNYFNGRIIDNNNRPVANATIQLVNTNNGYVTDQFGNFKIPGTDTLINVHVSVVGYASQNFQLRNDVSLNQLQLQPDVGSISEVVVVADNKKAKQKTNYKTKYPNVLVQDAEPVNGWTEFNKYIEANRRTIVNENSKTGEVVISFQVNLDNQLSRFKIEQTLSQAQDAEAIRLIKEGPSWHLLKGKKTRVLVIIRF